MPKLGCPCGHVHDLSSIPDHGWLTVSDVTADRLTEPDGTIRFRELLQNSGRLYEFPACGRVMWETPGRECFEIFRRDEGNS
jgi:hypothetical protein